MGLLIVKWLFLSISCGRSRTVARSPKVIEVEFGDGLQLVGQARSFEVVRDVVELGAVFLLQTD
jgi:hypothetical protein